RILDFDGPKTRLPIDHEIHLDSRTRAPEEQSGVISAIRKPGTQVLRNQTFKSLAVNFGRAIQWPARTQRTEDARVKQKKLLMSDGFTLGPPGKHRYSKGQQEVFQDFNVGADCLAFDLAFA